MANEYQPNSHKYKKEQAELAENKPKKAEKVVTGQVRIKKKNKLTDVFISEDAKNVKSYALMEVLVPALKKAVVDIVTDGVNMIFYGEKGRRSSGIDRISYRQYSDPRNTPRVGPTRPNSVYDYDKITLESRSEAEAVLTGLDDMIETYGRATVADLYDLIGVSHNFTDNAYGWYNLSEARAVPALGGGFTLRLPKVTPIEK